MEAATATRRGSPRPGRIPRSVPDGRLVARLRAGDERAFELIYDRYHRELLGFCRHMVGTREEAEDVLQHVMVSAHRHLVGGSDDIQLRPWLYAVARNRCISVLRARREAVALDDVPEPVTGEGLAVAAEVERREDLQAMLGDLARLPDDQRAALVLSELGALTHDEVAAALGVRRDKVKALVFQARESLAAYRTARDADCTAIREQLANLRGGALRRGPLRKHLDVCEGCRAFRAEVRRQREAMALLLPVVPTVALKAKVLGAVVAGGSAAAAPIGAGIGGAVAAGQAAGTAAGSAAAGSTVAGSGAALGGGLAAKALVAAAVAGFAGGGYAVVDEVSSFKPAAQRSAPAVHVPKTAAHAPASPATPATSAIPARGATAAPRQPDATGKRAEGKGPDKPQAAAGGVSTSSGSSAATKDAGHPAVPGANGKGQAKKGQGLDRRRSDPPARGANGTQPGQAKPKTHGKAMAAPQPAKDTAPETKPAHPGKPAKPDTSNVPAETPADTSPGNAKGHAKKADDGSVGGGA